ncbi:Response regulator receiver domain protein [Syntrophobacter sp. SbD1]|nr:Response regulator receiver domain protein [Syntrophobacter sp. SbD1]
MRRRLEILILDDEPLVGQRLKPALEKEHYNVEIFVEPKGALARMREKKFDIVVTDIRMEELDGLQVLENVRANSPETKVIMITGYASIETAREAVTKGAFDFIAKPFRIGTIRDVIMKAARALEDELAGSEL